MSQLHQLDRPPGRTFDGKMFKFTLCFYFAVAELKRVDVCRLVWSDMKAEVLDLLVGTVIAKSRHFCGCTSWCTYVNWVAAFSIHPIKCIVVFLSLNIPLVVTGLSCCHVGIYLFIYLYLFYF